MKSFFFFIFYRTTGNYFIAETLVNKGADVDAKEKNSNTPLHSAAYGESYEHYLIANLLVNHHANVNASNVNNEKPWDVTHNQQSKFVNHYKKN